MVKAMWQAYSAKFLTITSREQYLILLTGLFVILFGGFSLVIEKQLANTATIKKQINQLNINQKSAQTTIGILEQSLQQDPNQAIERQISQYEQKLAEVNNELLLLTTDLINPIQMRHALIELLKTQKQVSLVSFEVVGVQPMTLSSATPAQSAIASNEEKTDKSEDSLTLYKHAIKVTLQGRYFALRDYLRQLEQLDWTFFWQSFDYQLTEYPNSQLTIELYSLSTRKEFIGV